MSEGIRSMISIIVVMVFLFIVFRKRFLPLFRKKKAGTAVKLTATVPAEGICGCDVLVFDVLAYGDLKDFQQDVCLQLNRKLNYACMRAASSSVSYLALGSIFLAVVEWHTED